jgi:hypothetical protein
MSLDIHSQNQPDYLRAKIGTLLPEGTTYVN